MMAGYVRGDRGIRREPTSAHFHFCLMSSMPSGVSISFSDRKSSSSWWLICKTSWFPPSHIHEVVSLVLQVLCHPFQRCLLNLKWKESHDEYQHGNFKYLVMAVGQPTKVPHGLAVRMRDMLKCQKITVLQKLMSEGIVADEDGELVFDIDAWDKIWGKYALIWHNGDPAHPVRCSCWMWSFRNHCVHAWLGLLQRKRVCGSGQFTFASMRVLSMLELRDVNGNKPTLTNQRKLGSNTSELRKTFTWCN